MFDMCEKIFYKFITALALIAVCGAIVYRLYSLNNLGVIIALILASICFIIIIFIELKINKKPTQLRIKDKAIYCKKNIKEYNLASLAISGVYLVLIFLCFFVLYKNQTTASIISPWQVISSKFFIFYFLASLVLIYSAYKNYSYSLIFISIHSFLTFSVAVLVYKLGYGFDTFIHEATLNLIDKDGFVSPKPLYYLGQYSLIIIFHKLFFIPISLLNKFLLPILSSILLPSAIYLSLKQLATNQKTVFISTVSLLAIPFSIFIISTPQNLAFLFLILALLMGLICKDLICLITIYLLALASLLTQPIAGIPAIIFSVVLTVYHCDFRQYKRIVILLLFCLSSIALPLSLIVVNKSLKITAVLDGFKNSFINLFSTAVPSQDNFILNFTYLYAYNVKFILSIIILTGIFWTIRNRNEYKILIVYLGMSLSLLISYFLCSVLKFDFLISYEHADFVNRILITAALFSLPFVLLSIQNIINRITEQKKEIIIFTSIFLASLITTSLYVSYPRFDRYFNSRGYSVGQNDIEAVRWIDKNADGDYLVLANQQVSAAALSQFGFKRYYDNNIFYYPIPTSSPLYQYYLDMVYKKPDKRTITEAMDMVGVNQGYFVLNKYWWQFPKILAEAKFSADSWKEFGNGEVFVFKFAR